MASPAAGVTDAKLLDDSDDDFQYEEVEVLSDQDDDISEDLDSALRSLQSLTTREPPSPGPRHAPPPGQVSRRPEVIDDFLRNFFVRMGLSKTNEVFESEWYELKASGKLDNNSGTVPDVYLRNMELEDEVQALRSELDQTKQIATRASSTWDKFRKERDFHRMHHKRVAQEKNKLITDIKRLRDHFSKYEPTILELKRKYEAAMKEKMLAVIERDRLQAKVDAVSHQIKAAPADRGNNVSLEGIAKQQQQQQVPGTDRSSGGTAKLRATLPAAPRKNPVEDLDISPAMVAAFSLQKTFKGHLLSVANLVLHPTKSILVTASDDKTWKMWHLPNGDLIMCGEGHKDWVAGVDFHPHGQHLASGSGDSTVKIWSFEKQRCVATFTDHKQAVWGVKFHDTGDFVASCSLDHSVRLWDVSATKCRQVLRGHVDSVNDLCWQPYSNVLCTASSDKTVSVWDMRSGLCTQTFYGHQNSCNAAVFNLQGSAVASSDADGGIKLWDMRMAAEILTIDAGKHPANKVAFDPSGTALSVASDDGKVKCYSTKNGDAICELSGHEDAVQACIFDPAGQFLVSCGSDNTFRLWA